MTRKMLISMVFCLQISVRLAGKGEHIFCCLQVSFMSSGSWPVEQSASLMQPVLSHELLRDDSG